MSMPTAVRHLRSFLKLLSLTVLLAGCGTRERADFVMANTSEPETLDPALITAQADSRIASSLFEGLLSRDPAGRLIPAVAERWEISDDALTYTFYLRETARWSDGQPVTAHDFVNSWRRVLTPETGSKYADLTLYAVEGAEDYHRGRTTDFSTVGVVALDDHTLQVKLHSPVPYFLDLVAFITTFPVRTDLVAELGNKWMRPGHLVCNGPFVLRSWRINDHVRLELNPFYWDAENVHLRTVDILPLTQATTALNFYLSGVIDLVPDKGLVPAPLLDHLKERRDFHSAPILATYFFRVNVTRPPLDNLLVRQALAHAVDRQFITEKITRAGEPASASFVPPGLPGYEPAKGLEYNPAWARELLAKAGFPSAAGLGVIEVLYNPSDINDAVAQAIQAMWTRELGVTVELRRQEFRTYLGTMSQLNYMVARSSWIGDYADPSTFLGCFVSGSGNNRTGFSDAQYDQLLRLAERELDPAKRMLLLRQAEQILLHQAVIIPVFHFVTVKLFDPERFQGVGMNLLDEIPLKHIRPVSAAAK